MGNLKAEAEPRAESGSGWVRLRPGVERSAGDTSVGQIAHVRRTHETETLGRHQLVLV
jgi:hypothetical protein